MAFVETTFNILYAIIYIPVSTLEMGPLPIGKITLRTLWRSLKPMESSLKLEYTRCFISTFIPVLAYSMYVEFELYNIRNDPKYMEHIVNQMKMLEGKGSPDLMAANTLAQQFSSSVEIDSYQAAIDTVGSEVSDLVTPT